MKQHALLFDCDGTLSDLEGIVELARMNQQLDTVASLTEMAMSTTGMTQAIYQQRLDLVKPSQQQCLDLAELYYNTRSPGIDNVLLFCQQHAIDVFVISAGVNPSVREFANKLGIASEHVYAVELTFDEQGHYLTYDHDSPMTMAKGKQTIVQQLRQHYQRLSYVGDGQNDLDVIDDVDTFIGYGGAFYRESMAQACQHYITEHSLVPVMSLIN